MAKHNKLNERLRSQQDLPAELSWDKMQDGIIQRMPATTAPKVAAPLSARFGKFLGLISVTTLVVAYFYISASNESKAITTTQVTQSKAITLGTQSTTTPTNKILDNKSNDNTDKAASTPIAAVDNQVTAPRTQKKHTNINKRVASKNAAPTSIPSADETKQKSSSADNINSLQNNFATKPTDKIKNEIYPQKEGTIKNSPQGTSAHTAKKSLTYRTNNIQQAAEKESLLKVQKINNQFQQVHRTTTPFELPPHLTISLPAANNLASDTKDKKWATSIGIGATYWKSNNRGDNLATAKNTFEKELISYGTNLSIQYQLSQDWSISTGLGYQKIESLFDYQTQYDTTRSTNVASENVRVTRTVLSNNKYQIYSIPLTIHKSWRVKQLELMAGLGINYRVSLDNTGKTLANGSLNNPQVVKLEDLEPLALSQWSAVIQLDLRYDIGDNTFAGASLMTSSPFKEIQLGTNLTQRPLWLQASLVIGTRF